MSTVVRPVVGYRNPYYISKERYYELKHFCLQYNEYKRRIAIEGARSLSKSIIEVRRRSNQTNDPTGFRAALGASYEHYIDIIDKCCQEAGGDISEWLKESVTLGKSYATLNPPCCKGYFYKRYRKFFWLLDKFR